MMTFNSAGLRDREYSAYPAPKTYRILLMGASNVLGIGLPEEKTLPRLLEAELTRKLNRKIEVVNGATNGYCTWQSAFRLRELLDLYHPDLVLYNIGMPSCLIYDRIWESRLVSDVEGNFVGIDRSLVPRDSFFSFVNRAYFHPKVFSFLHTIHEMSRRAVFVWKLKFKMGDEPQKFISESTKRALSYMSKASLKKGSFFIGFFHPSQEPVENMYLPYFMSPAIANFITALQPTVHVPHRSLNSEFHNGEFASLFLGDFLYEALPDDGHLTQDSIADWSQRLARKLAGALAFRKESAEKVEFDPSGKRFAR